MLSEEEIEKINARRFQAFIEGSKFTFEALKHLTTLATGSIVLMTTFMERLFKNQATWRGLLIATLLAFMLCILSAVSGLLQAGRLLNSTTINTPDVQYLHIYRSATISIAFFSFLFGVISLTIFAIKNLN